MKRDEAKRFSSSPPGIRMQRPLWFVLVLALWNPLIAQTPAAPPEESLSLAEVKAALAGDGSKHWITLTDNRLMLAAALSGRGELAQEPSVTLLMPDAIIAMRSTFARKQFLSYWPDAEDRRRSLTVVAEGIAIGSPSGPACSSITRVVLLSDRSGATTAEAYRSETTGETWQNGFGASSQCQSLRARFSLAGVHKVQAAAPHGEFLIGVFYLNDADPRIYKVKGRHLEKLGLRF